MFITYVLMNALLINGTNKFIGVKIVDSLTIDILSYLFSHEN